MNFKKMLSLPIAVSFSLSVFMAGINANATTYRRLIDNDPVSSSGNGYTCSDNMIYYSGMTSSYNNDMRLSEEITNTSASARWEYPRVYPNGYCNVDLRVYLNNANFTDQDALYHIEVCDGGWTQVGTIDQKYAPAGWSKISRRVSIQNTGRVEVTASHGSTKQLGSDAIEVNLSY